MSPRKRRDDASLGERMGSLKCVLIVGYGLAFYLNTASICSPINSLVQFSIAVEKFTKTLDCGS